tara:strand:+ start:281 stop:490 length:210 start_codon:yes stop_codon:yes gene_type:complete
VQAGTVNVLSTILAMVAEIVYIGFIHRRLMSKEMTSKEKLLFITSFIWAMHWGVRVAFAAITTLELKFF